MTPKVARAGGYAALVAAGILLSRVAGLIRTRFIGHYLGTSAAADAFSVAQKIPNFLQNLLGEGVLSASFIPVYAKLVARGDEKLAGRVAGVFVSILSLLVSVIVLIGVLLTPVILKITAAGLDGPTYDLAVRLVRIIFPGVGLLVLSAWCLGILNTHRQFFLSYVAPVLWNAAQIAALAIFGSRLHDGELAVALAWGMVVGCGLQLAVQVPFVIRHAKHLSFGFDRNLEPVRTIFRNLGPAVGGRGVLQISAYVDTFIGSFLPSGALSSLLYAQTVYMMPISIFGMSVAAAELPQMAGIGGAEEEIRASLRKRLDRGIRQIAFFVIPTTVAFIAIGRLLIAALYQTGDFTAKTSLIIWYMLAGSTIGLLVATMGRLYQSTFYALHDTKTPFRFAVARVIGGSALAVAFAFPLRGMFPAIIRALGLEDPMSVAAYGAIGITTASGIASWIEFLLLRRAVRTRLGEGEPKLAFFSKLWMAAIAAAIAAVAFDIFVARGLAARLPLRHVAEAIVVSGVFGVVYFAAAFAAGVPEVRATLGRFTRK